MSSFLKNLDEEMFKGKSALHWLESVQQTEMVLCYLPIFLLQLIFVNENIHLATPIGKLIIILIHPKTPAQIHPYSTELRGHSAGSFYPISCMWSCQMPSDLFWMAKDSTWQPPSCQSTSLTYWPPVLSSLQDNTDPPVNSVQYINYLSTLIPHLKSLCGLISGE